MHALRLPVFTVVGLALVSLVACEPEVGMPCSPSEPYVNSRVLQEAGRNDLVRDINFENCTQLLCLSSDGSRPYCTRSCETDLDCSADGFVCAQVVNFGPLACEGEDPQRTCVEPDGSPSEPAIFYCVAPTSVIEERDQQFGRGG